jgi:hypothetical protein
MQRVLGEDSYAAPVDVYAAMTPSEADVLVSEVVARGFDLSVDIPIRVLLIPHGDDRWRLATAAHNIAFDGWSEHLFLGDIARAYGAHANGTRFQFAAARPYRDYVRWERGWLRSPEHDELLASAERALKEAQDASWEPSIADPESPAVAEHQFEIGAGRLDDIRTALGPAKIGLASAIGFAFHRATASLSTSPNIAVGTVVDARAGRHFVDTVGSFTRVTPIGPLARDDTAARELAAFSKALDDATKWAALPFDEIAAAVDPTSPSSSPVFQACYVLQHTPVETLRIGEATARRLPPPPEESAPFDLFLELIPRGGGLTAFATSRGDAIGNDGLQRFVAAFIAEIDRLCRVEKVGYAQKTNSPSSWRPMNDPTEIRESGSGDIPTAWALRELKMIKSPGRGGTSTFRVDWKSSGS